MAVVPVFNLGPREERRRVVALGAAILLGTLAAAGVLWTLEPLLWPPEEQDDYLTILRHEGAVVAVLTALSVAVAAFYQRTHDHLQSVHEAELERNELERQMTQARIQVLQAQIEPHFLFNTLANVRRMYETDRDGGHRMLDNLMRYLEVALPHMRTERSTLAREIALIQSYLNVQQVRFGRRLVFSIEVPQALESAGVPPMMLLTLVENALKHGIAPQPEGGSVRVVAEAAGDRLLLSVTDTGRGLTGMTGAGTGLANIHARLAAAYGSAASLRLLGNAPHGIIAQICLPMPATAAWEASG
jgi:LytS/YehU family sensor histidine kinase